MNNENINGMSSANIEKDRNTRILLTANHQPLTNAERRALSKAILGKDNLKATYIACDVSELTIKRAIAGFKLKPDTALKIRSFLNSDQ